MSKKLRTVITTERFLDEFREIDPNPERLEIFLRRLEWRILENPEQGFRTEFVKIWGTDFRHLRNDVVVYYSFNGTQLFLESIRLEDFAEPPNED